MVVYVYYRVNELFTIACFILTHLVQASFRGSLLTKVLTVSTVWRIFTTEHQESTVNQPSK